MFNHGKHLINARFPIILNPPNSPIKYVESSPFGDEGAEF